MSKKSTVDNPHHHLYNDPKPKDLSVVGANLLKIEFHFNSFTVSYQLPGINRWEFQLQVLKKTFPIQFIQDFFKENSKYESRYYAMRHADYWDKEKS
jgi:hypothetical protein